MIEQNSIESLKNRIDIVDVISGYIELKKSGANFKANCPFHGERTPSFVVSPAKQIYHCFGCNAGGDSIKFVMEYEKLSYPEAIEKLASSYGIELRYDKKNQNSYTSDNKIVEELNKFFRRYLDQNEEAKRYLKDRGIYESSIEKFEIGYAPNSSVTLDFLRSKSASYKKLRELGLVVVDENNRPYARFSNRITFPIFTPNGKIVGFGGRTISNHPAKYINSPQSKIFDKSKLLYGYHKAKTTIYKNSEIIVCEGYLDVVMLHQAGFSNAVASLGTALTNQHVPILSKANPKVILAYDGDRAGKQAAYKASVMLSSRGINGGVVIFRKGFDPADMVREGKVVDLKKLFKNPKPMIEYAIEYIISKHDIKIPIQKQNALNEVLEYMKVLTPLLQNEYKSYVSVLLNIDQKLVRIRGKSQNNFSQNVNSLKKEDISELSVIKSFLKNQKFVDLFLANVGEEFFKTHFQEFKLVVENKLNDPMLLGIEIRDDLLELNEQQLKDQMRFFLIKHYKQELVKIKQNRNIAFDEKSFYLRKIQDNLQKLNKGVLVKYERYGE